ncbi:Dolichyl-phosphate-mannose-protein mannosyltransferase [Halobiforma haloterrestris]|uniref:Dolichyl-phosphate-mannose-protein mannosyltransferase n=1 Tax=Natronobacterium haloterrestre TaxID=148448 RepID=A0A1I1ECW3_NATHA|nr:glycosyltransferase family 39 protein [Halobiforma haloterrestris]SFB82753.1 Dolichyl-phosphate-mannose-protein mannosyltransferase [Halobiforma haloterrestris]
MSDRLLRLLSRPIRSDRVDRPTLYAFCIAALAGAAVFVVATQLFPYHSSNDDEAVYLMQAAMLLEGQLELYVGDLVDAFRPWFFVEDGGRLYPKYSPVPAAMYAATMAVFGEPRVTLAIVAAGNAALTYVLGSQVFDRRVGVVAAALFAASPLALLTSSVFLPYAPTTLFNLAFAVAYLRGVRTGRLRDAALAGVAIGLAFFARPYTAVLFAAPFIGHALWQVTGSLRREWDGTVALRALPDPVRRHAVTGLFGLAFVGLTLAYNARVTGSPLLFPYEAFAPLDGPGFGYREIQGHSIEYTPALALEANGYVLWYFATRWFVAGPIGTLAALAGLVLALRRWAPSTSGLERTLDGDRTAGILLAALFVTVPLGNLAFWGNFNVLATMNDPTNGLISQFGPFYHFDLLAPLSIFAAFGFVAGWRRLRDAAIRERIPEPTARNARRLALAALVTSALVVGGVNAALLAGPVERNAAHTERYETAYEPFEQRDVENALVFLPTPYGQWQGHPFQALRNDPGLDGEAVYALEGDPEHDFAVLEAYPDRDYYRYDYRGEWTAGPDEPVIPKLEPLEVREGETLAGETVVGVPDRVSRASIRLASNGSTAWHTVDDPGDSLAVDWELRAGAGDATDNGTAPAVASLDVPDEGSAAPSVALEETDEVVLTITLVQSDGGTFTYRQATTVRATDDGIAAVWPPERTGCRLVTECGREGTYLPDRPDVHPEWERFETRLEPAD